MAAKLFFFFFKGLMQPLKINLLPLKTSSKDFGVKVNKRKNNLFLKV